MNRLPDFQQQPHSDLVRLLKEANELANQCRCEALRRKLQRELQETHNSCMAHVAVVRRLERRAISLIRRLNIVNEKVAQ